MSVDNMLDAWTSKCAGIFLSFIPYPVILSAINLYFGSILLVKRILSQSLVTLRAVGNSFYSTRLFFYKYGSTFVPVVHRGGEIPAIYGAYDWIYQTDERSFISSFAEENTKGIRFSYLGGTLIYSSGPDVSYIDITDWLSEQRIFSNSDEVPLQVLVAAWAHTNNSSVWHTYDCYKITFMTLEGEEITYDVATGEKISMPDDESLLEETINEGASNNTLNTVVEESSTEQTSSEQTSSEQTSSEETTEPKQN